MFPGEELPTIPSTGRPRVCVHVHMSCSTATRKPGSPHLLVNIERDFGGLERRALVGSVKAERRDGHDGWRRAGGDHGVDGQVSNVSVDSSRVSRSLSPPPSSARASRAAAGSSRRSADFKDPSHDPPLPARAALGRAGSLLVPATGTAAAGPGDVSVWSSTTFGEVRSSYSELSAKRSPQRHWP